MHALFAICNISVPLKVWWGA